MKSKCCTVPEFTCYLNTHTDFICSPFELPHRKTPVVLKTVERLRLKT